MRNIEKKVAIVSVDPSFLREAESDERIRLIRMIQEHSSDESVTGIALIGGGDAFFGEGRNRASFLSLTADLISSGEDESTEHNALLSTISACTKTVVCIVNGRVSGSSGLELIMSCDYRVVSESSTFGGEDEISFSMISGISVKTSSFHPRKSDSKHLAMQKLLEGQSISAWEAREIGLVDEIVNEVEELENVGRQIAAKHKKRQHQARLSKMKRLLYYIPEQFLMYRAHQVFNMIRDYPESMPCLEELKVVLSFTSQTEYVISQMKNQLEDRLLIPGAHTEDVLQMYLRTYKVVSFLFGEQQTGNLISVFLRIARPIIDHLQKRPDSVKCIVSTLLEDNQQSQEEQDADELAALLVDDEGGVASGIKKKNLAKNDTMSLLIGVYGGKDSFLSEYREMLASRLVSVTSFEIDREIASLELMKSKFSESIDSSSSEALTHCSVMIKDLVESKKLNQRIKADLSTSRKIKHSNLLTMLVKSAHFWPNKSSSTSESSEHETAQQQFPFLPEPIREAMAEFERKFTELKPSQKIEWLRCEGVVTFSVLIRGKETEFRLSPIYVEVLSLFEPLGLPRSSPNSTQPAACLAPTNVSVCLSLESIASGVSLSADQVKPVVQFWVSKGILREIEINKFSTFDE